MQLEKATSRSNEAALAGWIASNDVTLFTTVLVLAIALFLHTRLSKGAREKSRLSEEKTALAMRLTATSDELGLSNESLDRTRNALHLTQDERDQLRQQLVEKLDSISRLNTRLDTLLREKDELELQRQTLIDTNELQSQEKAELVAQQASLAKERDSLSTANLSLRERLESLSSQLDEKIAALEQLELQRARLKNQADELSAIVAGLEDKLEKLNINLADTRSRAAAVRAASTSEIKELKSQLAAREKTAEEHLAELKRATALFQGLQVEKEQLERQLTAAELQRQAELLEEGRNNRALVGLTGRLERVAVLFDASGSMREASASGGSDRWAEAQQIAATWLQHLNVQQCVLIVFSSDVRTFPEDGSLADLRGERGQAKREALLQHVKAVSPAGSTNTLDALRKAYQYDLDGILLFSDGAPTRSNSGLFDRAIAQQIYALCRQHPDIPIHTIGLGNYFDHNASTFLRSLAQFTGGTFRGR